MGMKKKSAAILVITVLFLVLWAFIMRYKSEAKNMRNYDIETISASQDKDIDVNIHGPKFEGITEKEDNYVINAAFASCDHNDFYKLDKVRGTYYLNNKNQNIDFIAQRGSFDKHNRILQLDENVLIHHGQYVLELQDLVINLEQSTAATVNPVELVSQRSSITSLSCRTDIKKQTIHLKGNVRASFKVNNS